MIDTHAHILPGLDDGPETLQEALGFIKQAVNQGVRVLFATPHCCDGVYNCRKSDILNAYQNLYDAVNRSNMDIQIEHGSEIRLNHDLITQLDSGNLLTLGTSGKYLLIELPPVFIPEAIFRIVRELKLRGVTPIIAHVERNPMIMTQPGLTEDLIFQGTMLQVTAASLTGDFGRGPLKLAKILAQNNQIFCLGSDIHPGRKYRMKMAEKILNKLIGQTRTHTILHKSPESILES